MEYTQKQIRALIYLRKNRKKLSVQQYKTIKGQILGGDVARAMKGLNKLLLINNQT